MAGEVGRLRSAGAVAATGNGLTDVVLALTLAATLHASGVAVALPGLSVGMLLSFARGGAVADSSDRVKTMARSDLVRCGMNILIAVAVIGAMTLGWSSVVATIVATAGCLGNGLMAGYFRPAQSSLWAAILPADRLTRELQINGLLNRTGLTVGAAIGGVLIALHLGVWGLVFDALMFLVTALLVVRLHDPRVPKEAGGSLGSRLADNLRKTLRIDREWREIIRLTERTSWMRLWFFSSLGASCATAVSSVVLPVVLVRSYSSVEAGAFESIRVIGMFVGGLVALWLGRIALAGLLDAWSGIGAALANLAVALGVPAAAPIAMLGTSYAAGAMAGPYMSTSVRQQFPDEARGRIYAAVQGVGSVLAPIGMLVGGVLMIFIDPAILATAAAIVAAGCFALPILRRSYWSFAA
ncbi:MAG: hypothetical protein QM607_11890 [Microbacterium sp.]